LIATKPDREQMAAYRSGGGAKKAAYAKLTVSYAADEVEARTAALRYWPNAAMGSFSLDLKTPRHFEEVAELVSEDDMAEAVVCSPDPAVHVAAIQEYFDAGFDRVFVHQVGPEQEKFFRFYERHVLPAFEPTTAVVNGGDKRRLAATRGGR
jgi:hypothetical protein